MDFRTCLEEERSRGALYVLDKSVDPHLSVARQLNENEPSAVLFNNVDGWRVAGNVFSNRDAFARYLAIPSGRFLQSLHEKLTSEPRQLIRENTVYGEIELEPPDLRRLPILYHYDGDGGPYITAGVWIVQDPVAGPNMSYHRMMVTGADRGTVRVVENRGTHNALSRTKGTAAAAICLGPPPAVLLAASCSPAPDVNEMELAARLDNITLQRCKTIDAWVPASAEIVLEGHFINEVGDEGPFVDITGTWDHVRQQPYFVVTRAAMRRNAIYHALVPGRSEHQILMGMPKEIDILNEVNRECRCLDVSITPGGSSWLHAVLQIDKQRGDDGRRALEAAFRAHKSLKHCVVVDTDVDIHDSHAVEWAIATRLQADRDVIIWKDQPASSLDPSAIHRPGQKSRSAKMGLDATIKNPARASLFRRVY